MFKERHDAGIGIPKIEDVKSEGLDHSLSHLVRFHLFKAGETLFEEGGRGREAFIIKSGKVRVETKAHGILGELGPGQMLGEMAIICDQDRVATATAEGETMCVALSRRAMIHMLDTVDMETRAIIEFLVDFITYKVEGTETPEDISDARNKQRILEILIETPDTKTKLALQEPFFRLLCNSLFERACGQGD